MDATSKPSFYIKEAIARAIVFFDILGCPLTGYEIWKHLYADAGRQAAALSLGKVTVALEEELAMKRLDMKNGFYFLPGREELVETRLRSINLANHKFITAIRSARYLRFVPGVKMVAVCNSLAMGNVHDGSDIDLFIVTGRNRIWLTRLFVTGVIHLLGVRRHSKKINDRVCLSFYISEDDLNLKPISMEEDPYFNYWISTLIPTYDDRCFSRFIEANSWIKKHLPNYSPVIPHRNRTVQDNIFSRTFRVFGVWWLYSSFGDFLEKIAKSVQLKKMSKNTGSLAKENDTRVIISDTILKFHETDKRGEYRDKWIKKTNEILG